MRLTDEMKQMVEHLRLCDVATVTPDGKPNLSPKGTLKVWDGGTLVFADIASPHNSRDHRLFRPPSGREHFLRQSAEPWKNRWISLPYSLCDYAINANGNTIAV